MLKKGIVLFNCGLAFDLGQSTHLEKLFMVNVFNVLNPQIILCRILTI
jgi:hypothetical protein